MMRNIFLYASCVAFVVGLMAVSPWFLLSILGAMGIVFWWSEEH